jgi:hypothetical protein
MKITQKFDKLHDILKVRVIGIIIKILSRLHD